MPQRQKIRAYHNRVDYAYGAYLPIADATLLLHLAAVEHFTSVAFNMLSILRFQEPGDVQGLAIAIRKITRITLRRRIVSRWSLDGRAVAKLMHQVTSRLHSLCKALSCPFSSKCHCCRKGMTVSQSTPTGTWWSICFDCSLLQTLFFFVRTKQYK